MCNRCKVTPIRVCYLDDARSRAEFLGMCESCYRGWLMQFPVYSDRTVAGGRDSDAG